MPLYRPHPAVDYVPSCHLMRHVYAAVGVVSQFLFLLILVKADGNIRVKGSLSFVIGDIS